MGLLCSLILGSLRKGMLFGIVGGMVFAVGIVLFQGILASRKDKLRERYGIAGMVLRDGAANHMVGKEAVGGWIFLMEDRFCFVSHAFNVTTGAWTVPYSAIADGGSMPTVFNAANECAVAKFLDRKIRFLDIYRIIEECMASHTVIENPDVSQILDTERWVYDFVESRW